MPRRLHVHFILKCGYSQSYFFIPRNFSCAPVPARFGTCHRDPRRAKSLPQWMALCPSARDYSIHKNTDMPYIYDSIIRFYLFWDILPMKNIVFYRTIEEVILMMHFIRSVIFNRDNSSLHAKLLRTRSICAPKMHSQKRGICSFKGNILPYPYMEMNQH